MNGIRVQWVRNLGTKGIYLTDYRLLIVDADLTRDEVAELAAEVLLAAA